MHRAPEPGFFRPHGTYHPKCRPSPVPRFRCRACRRTFSRQTFRADYCDNRPHLNAQLFRLLASGIGLRQCGRLLQLTRRCTELKARKVGRHLRQLNLNVLGPLPPGSALMLDELETYEGRRNTRPLTVPVVMESSSWFLLWAESAMIPPSGKMTPLRERLIERDRERFGRRRDLSGTAVRRSLERVAPHVEHLESLRIDTDEKLSYPGLIEAALGKEGLEHVRTSSKLVRDKANPLFPINQSEAVMRDLMGRMRRESWLVSKQRRYLDIALHVHIGYRNLVRARFNHDPRSCAEALGLMRRRLNYEEALSWRQVFGARSLHPLTRGKRTFEEVRAAA